MEGVVPWIVFRKIEVVPIESPETVVAARQSRIVERSGEGGNGDIRGHGVLFVRYFSLFFAFSFFITADIEEQKTFEKHGFTGILLKPLTIDKLAGFFN